MTDFRLQVIDFPAFVFVHPPPEKTAVIYRRKTIRGNMLLNVVAIAHQQESVSASSFSSFFSGMCALRAASDVARIQFSSLLCRLTFLHSNSDTENVFDDVELDVGREENVC